MKDAVLSVPPTAGDGITWDDLLQAVAPLVPTGYFPHFGSVRRYSKSVQLDPEAKRVIERVPRSKPLRFRKIAQS